MSPVWVSDWTYVCVVSNANNQVGKNPGGTQGYGGNVSEKGPSPVNGAGTYSAAIREQVRIFQQVSVPESGRYRLSFVFAKRKNYTDGMVLYPRIDGADLAELNPSSSAFESFGTTVELEAGPHELSFYVDGTWTGSTGPVAFVDLVRLSRVAPAIALPEGVAVDMASGSTLRLENIQDLTIADFRVNGARINGGRSAIRSAGVTIVGDGKIHVGDRLGLLIIYR